MTAIRFFQIRVYIFAQVKQHFLILNTDIETRTSLDVHQPDWLLATKFKFLRDFFDVRVFSPINFNETFTVGYKMSFNTKMNCISYNCADSYIGWSRHS